MGDAEPPLVVEDHGLHSRLDLWPPPGLGWLGSPPRSRHRPKVSLPAVGPT